MIKTIKNLIVPIVIATVMSGCAAKHAKGVRSSDAAGSSPVINLVYSFSDGLLSSIDREPVEDMEKMAKVHIKKFGANIIKRLSVKVIRDAEGKKMRYVNAVLHLDNISGECWHGRLYESAVSFTVFIRTPGKGVIFEKKYSGRGAIEFGKQWSEWIGRKKSAKFAFKNVLGKVLGDAEFGNALSGIPASEYFEAGDSDILPVVEKISNGKPAEVQKIPLSTEDRIRTLESLKSKGLITEDEFNKKKAKILEEL